jgi:hypothetical protein
MFRNSGLQERSLLFHAGTCARSISKALSKQILAFSGHELKRTKGTTPIWAFRGGSKYYGYKGGRGLDNTGRYNETRKPYHSSSYSDGYVKSRRLVV